MPDTVLGTVERTGNEFWSFESCIKVYSLNDQQRNKQKFGGTFAIPQVYPRVYTEKLCSNEQSAKDCRNSSDFRRQK